jgi:hypothetical protein
MPRKNKLTKLLKSLVISWLCRVRKCPGFYSHIWKRSQMARQILQRHYCIFNIGFSAVVKGHECLAAKLKQSAGNI